MLLTVVLCNAARACAIATLLLLAGIWYSLHNAWSSRRLRLWYFISPPFSPPPPATAAAAAAACGCIATLDPPLPNITTRTQNLPPPRKEEGKKHDPNDSHTQVIMGIACTILGSRSENLRKKFAVCTGHFVHATEP